MKITCPNALARRCGEKSFPVVSVLVLFLFMGMFSGCAHFGLGRKDHGISTLKAYHLQLELMRFADEFSSMAGEVADDLTAKAKTPRERVRPLAMKVSQASAAMAIASDPNPLGGIMDMAVLVTLTRASFEDYLVPKVYGEDAKGVVEKYRKAEAAAWKLVELILNPQQEAELKKSIDQWRAENPDQRYVSFVRLKNMYKPQPARKNNSDAPESIFGLLFLDPFAGLDPAAREIEQSRYTAERAMYQLQRMPRMLDWQLSLVFAKSLALPEIRDLLTDADRLSKAADELPGKISSERAAIVKELESGEPRLRALLTESRMTIEACENAANSVNETVKSLNSFAARFDKNSTPGVTNAPAVKPFDVTEYGTSATQIAGTVRELNTLINSAEQKILPQAEAAIVRAKSAGTELVDHAFHRAVTFVFITLACAVAAMLSYRAIAGRFLNAKGR